MGKGSHNLHNRTKIPHSQMTDNWNNIDWSKKDGNTDAETTDEEIDSDGGEVPEVSEDNSSSET